jgi:phage gp16-like protein
MMPETKLPEAERRRLLAKIHIAKKQLDLNEEEYRAMLQREGGEDSAAKLSVTGLLNVIRWCERCGFKPVSKSSKKLLSPTSSEVEHDRRSKAIALWIKLHKAGKVRDRSHQALENFVRGRIGKSLRVLPGVSPLNAATPKQMHTAITALEAWLEQSN